MPSKKKNKLSTTSKAAKRAKLSRSMETSEEREKRLNDCRKRASRLRNHETASQGEARLARVKQRAATSRQDETSSQREARLARDKQRAATSRQDETSSQREARLAREKQRAATSRQDETSSQREARLVAKKQQLEISRREETIEQREFRLSKDKDRHGDRQIRQWRHKLNSAFSYDPSVDYKEGGNVGLMNVVCRYCQALTWKLETKGLCCSSGKVSLQQLPEPPEPLKSLLNNQHPNSRHFFENIRRYNSAFSMTSFGASEVSESGYMPTFKIQGQVYHLIGSVMPPDNKVPSFLQIYFVSDAAEQVRTRASNFSNLDSSIIEELQALLHQNNPYIGSLKTALESIAEDASNEFNIVIKADRRPTGEHPGRYNEPSVNEVAVVMVGDPTDRRDIVLRTRGHELKRISETHRSYDTLQYPLIFCRGEDGYNFQLFHVDPSTGENTNKKTSALEFYSSRLMTRHNAYNHLHLFRQLFNQFLVDMYAKIESERLNYIRFNQKKLRAESYVHLQDALRREENLEDLGTMVILPSSFTGGPRYMHARTQDAFCYVRKYGRPDLFITMTTNPKWEEIENQLYPGQKSQDRHDITARVFHLKLKKLMELFNKGRIFGTPRCYMYSVEWQKRGLPHAHILLWIEETIHSDRIDDIIRAELPDPNSDPHLFEVIKRHMIHGPCGPINPNCPCMKEGRCSKKYPRRLVEATQTGEDGYPTYRRRASESGGFTARVKVGREFFEVDNRWIVPYNPVLSRTFTTHINVEYCSSVKSIKYICKYVHKGTDQATFGIRNENDEIEVYQSGRYISSSEAVWRMLSFPIYERYPPVIHLDVHLENGQRIYFSANNVQEMVENPKNTTLIAFFKLCQEDEFAQSLLYNEIPSYYTYCKKTGLFNRRKIGLPVDGHPGVKKDAAMGRVFTIHPGNIECYYLRMLLHTVRGPTSFEYLRTVDGVLHSTFQAACRAYGLLEDDTHWEDTLHEASVGESPKKLRELFSVMLVFCQIAGPMDIWNSFKDLLTQDFLRDAQRLNCSVNYENSPHLYEQCLSELEKIIKNMGGNSLEHYGLPSPQTTTETDNIHYLRETTYDQQELRNFLEANEYLLNDEQRVSYDTILQSVDTDAGNLFFLDALGGTGKTFLINLILAKMRSQRKICLAVATSGIAATLISGGRTAHSTFKIPIDIDRMDTPICSLSRNSSIAKVIRECSFIVWDEITMANRKCIEALNNTLMDIRKRNVTMGGITVLFSGDFRQTLPVVPGGTRADEINACLKRSPLWPQITRLALTKNMRVHLGAQTSLGQEFSNLLMRIGNGTMEVDTEGIFLIPPALATVVESLDALINYVFPGITNLESYDNIWLCDRAILTPKNDRASYINRHIITLFPGEEREYRSINTVLNQDDAVHYPVEFLDSVTAPGLPAHEIVLKVGAPIMLIRNLNPPKLCNGTRLRVKALHRNVIEADILTGSGKGESVYIPRIPIIPTNYPFEFKRLQFPVCVCFAMTINKSQGQTLSMAGLDLTENCFSHGQLYVACSRVRSAASLSIFAPQGKTKNIVYKEALQ